MTHDPHERPVEPIEQNGPTPGIAYPVPGQPSEPDRNGDQPEDEDTPYVKRDDGTDDVERDEYGRPVHRDDE